MSEGGPMPQVLLDVDDVVVTIATDEGTAWILDHAELRVRRGEVVGVVGESGCGKSTLVKTIIGVLPDSATVRGGRILFEGEDLLGLDERALTARVRGSRIGFIPQDPFLSLNPMFRVGTQLLEIMRWHAPPDEDGVRRSGRHRRRRHRQTLVEMLRAVQIPDPEDALERYPHQFSGGQRQRLMIAGALTCRPRLLIADEPTSALDVTTQLQILQLLKDLARRFDFSVLFVTHDFGVVAQLCDTVTVMYAGQTVESGPMERILNAPKHPYTQALIQCHPDRAGALEGIPGAVPPAVNVPPGCRFHPRCDRARDACRAGRPEMIVGPGDGHTVACVLYHDSAGLEAPVE